MQIKTISQLLKEGADLQKLLDFLMETESQSFVSELQEKRETYFNRINTFPEYVFLFFDDENNYFGYFCGELLNKIPETAEEIAFDHTPCNTSDGHVFYISSFAINKKYRKMHLGKIMFTKVFEILQKDSKIQEMILLVNEKWESARRIYEGCGFKIINTFENVFPPEPLIVDEKGNEENDNNKLNSDSNYTKGLLMRFIS